MSVNATEELLFDAQDQAARVERKLNWLITRAGGNPEEIGRLPDDTPWTVVLNDKAELYEVLLEPRPDGSLRVSRRRVFRADGAEYGDMIDMAPPPRAASQAGDAEAA